jgi:hypothetical protein
MPNRRGVAFLFFLLAGVSRDATPGGKARLTGFRVKWQKRIRFDSYTGGVLKG